MIRLSFVHDLRQRRDSAAAGLEFGKASQLVRQQPDETVEFLRQRRFDVRHLRYLYVLPRGPAVEAAAFACAFARGGEEGKAIARGFSPDSFEVM